MYFSLREIKEYIALGLLHDFADCSVYELVLLK